MTKRVAMAVAALLTAGLALVPGEASARMGGFHGGFRGGGFHGRAFHGGFGPRFVGPGFHRGFVHPGFFHRRAFFAPRHAFRPFPFFVGAVPAFYAAPYPACFVKKRVVLTYWGPVVRVRRFCF